MTKEEIKQAVEEYFNEMFAQDADYLDHITDSWIYDAEEWFLNLLRQEGIKIFTNVEYTKETEKLVWDFRGMALKRKKELYDEKYGKRDALYELYIIIRDIKGTKKRFESIKHNLKEFPKLNDSIVCMLNDLEDVLKVLRNYI